jgi:hypothetical protein
MRVAGAPCPFTTGLLLLMLRRAESLLFRHGENYSILNQFSDVSSDATDRNARNFHFFEKKSLFAVDGLFSMATLLTRLKRDSRSRKTKELVLAYFGTANWSSILSRHDEWQRESWPEIKLGFFVG